MNGAFISSSEWYFLIDNFGFLNQFQPVRKESSRDI